MEEIVEQLKKEKILMKVFISLIIILVVGIQSEKTYAQEEGVPETTTVLEEESVNEIEDNSVIEEDNDTEDGMYNETITKETSDSEMENSFFNKISLTDLFVGIIVPIVAAWISYYLAERAIRKKEHNRLYIQIELIKRELKVNDEEVRRYCSYVEQKNEMEKAMEFPLIFMKGFLISILDRLDAIKREYIRNGKIVSDKPTKIYVLAQKISDLQDEIDELEIKGYGDNLREEKRKAKLYVMQEEKEQYVQEMKNISDRNIYEEFLRMQNELERLMVGEVFGERAKVTGINYEISKYIYNRIKLFNEKIAKTKDDVIDLYADLVIFNVDLEVGPNGEFDEEEYDLFYGSMKCSDDDIKRELYKICEIYYKWIAYNRKIDNYKFDFSWLRWNEIASDFVLINDRELYVLLTEFYEKLSKFQEMESEKIYEYCVEQHETIENILDKLDKHEIKLSKKCK